MTWAVKVLKGLTVYNQGDISSKLWLIHALRTVWSQTAKRWEGGHHTLISNHITSCYPENLFCVVMQCTSDIHTPQKHKERWAYFLLVCAGLVFLESRLNFTKHYNLVGRLGGREENHLATVTATGVSRIWDQPFQIEWKKEKEALKTSTAYWVRRLKIAVQFWI